MLVDKLNLGLGKEYTPGQLNSGFRKAFSTRYYEKVYYTLSPSGSGGANLNCEVKENPLTSVKLGLSYHSFLGAAIITNITVRNLLLDKSRTMVKLQVGENFRGLLQHKQAFGRSMKNYLTASYLLEALPLPIYNQSNLKNKQFLYKLRFSKINFDYKRQFGTNAALALGISHLNQHLSSDVVSTNNYKGNIKNYYAYLGYEYNTINRRFFPSSGFDIQVELAHLFNRSSEVEEYFGDSVAEVNLNQNFLDPFYRLQGSFTKYTALSRRLTLIKCIGLGAHYNFSTFLLDGFFVGGVQQVFKSQYMFPGLMEGQLVATSYAGLQLGLQYRVAGELYMIGRGNYAFYDFSTRSKPIDLSVAKGILGTGLSLGYNLSAMPMEFTMMYSPEVDVLYGHVRIGFLF